MKRDETTLADQASQPISRRHALRWLGGLAASVPVLQLLACGDELDLAEGDEGDEGDDADSDGGQTADAGTDSGTGTASSWASGGTAAMTALASYPNPFDDEVDPSCTPTCSMTEGPCHDDQAPEREDISEGERGLPMRFGLRILDEDCAPVADADIDIWHCDVAGVYSSETADNPGFCTGDNQAALKARYFRGHRATDANGVAWFSSCFPGWYSGRAIHVHFTVRRNGRDGEEYLTSQVAFSTTLIQDVCGSHPDYASHGQPNTANTADTVFPADSVEDYVMETQRTSDGALLAWKTIIIRSSLGSSVCAASGSGGGGPGGGAGGPPPGM